jgi:hypothetical protein
VEQTDATDFNGSIAAVMFSKYLDGMLQCKHATSLCLTS